MGYIVSPKYKKSVRYETTYRHTSKEMAFAVHEQYYRFESFFVEFQPDVNIQEVKEWDVLELDDENIVKSYEPHEGDGDETSSFWSFARLTDDERDELEQYIEEEYGLYDHEDWEEVELEISIEGGVNIEPAK